MPVRPLSIPLALTLFMAVSGCAFDSSTGVLLDADSDVSTAPDESPDMSGESGGGGDTGGGDSGGGGDTGGGDSGGGDMGVGDTGGGDSGGTDGG